MAACLLRCRKETFLRLWEAKVLGKGQVAAIHKILNQPLL